VKLDVGDWADSDEIRHIFMADPLPPEVFEFKQKFEDVFSSHIDLRSLKRWRRRVLSEVHEQPTLQKWAQCGYELFYGKVVSLRPSDGPKRLQRLLESALKSQVDPLNIEASVSIDRQRLTLKCGGSHVLFSASPGRGYTEEWTSLVKSFSSLPQSALRSLYLCARALETGEESPVLVGPPCFKSTIATLLLSLCSPKDNNVVTIWVSSHITVSDFLGKLLPLPHSAILKHVAKLLPSDHKLTTAVKLWCQEKTVPELWTEAHREGFLADVGLGPEEKIGNCREVEREDDWSDEFSFGGSSDEEEPISVREAIPTPVTTEEFLRGQIRSFIYHRALECIASELRKELKHRKIPSTTGTCDLLQDCLALASKLPHHSSKKTAVLYALELIHRCNEEDHRCGSLFVHMDGPLSDAARRGALCLIEDIETAPASVLESINGLFENDRALPGISVSPEFRCVAICNDLAALSAAMHSRLTIVPAQGYGEDDKVELTVPLPDSEARNLWAQVVKALDKNRDFLPIRLLFDMRDHILNQRECSGFIERLAKALQLLVFQMAGISEVQKTGIINHLPVDLQTQVKVDLEQFAGVVAAQFSIRTVDIVAEADTEKGESRLSCCQKGVHLKFGTLLVDSSATKQIKLYVYNRSDKVLNCWIDKIPDGIGFTASPTNWELRSNSSIDMTITCNPKDCAKFEHKLKKIIIYVKAAEIDARLHIPIFVEVELVRPKMSVSPGFEVDFGKFCLVRPDYQTPACLRLACSPEKNLTTELSQTLVARNDCAVDLLVSTELVQKGNFFSMDPSTKVTVAPNCFLRLPITLAKQSPRGKHEATVKVEFGSDSFEVKLIATVLAAELVCEDQIDFGLFIPNTDTTRFLPLKNFGDWPARVQLRANATSYSTKINPQPTSFVVLPQTEVVLPLTISVGQSLNSTCTINADAPQRPREPRLVGKTAKIQFLSKSRSQTIKVEFSKPDEIRPFEVNMCCSDPVSDLNAYCNAYDGFSVLDMDRQQTKSQTSFTFKMQATVTPRVVGKLFLDRGQIRIASSLSPCEPLIIDCEISTKQPLLSFNWKDFILLTKPEQKTYTYDLRNTGNEILEVAKIKINDECHKSLSISPNTSKSITFDITDDRITIEWETNEWSYDEATSAVVPRKMYSKASSLFRLAPFDGTLKVEYPNMFTPSTRSK
jgi:hypothetical protein